MRVLATILLVAAVVTGCASTPENAAPPGDTKPVAAEGLPADTAVVRVAGMRFTPATITIRAGQSVTWRFDDNGLPHNVTGTGAAVDALRSPILASGVYTTVFDTPGTYPYECTLHPEMTGTVVVTA